MTTYHGMKNMAYLKINVLIQVSYFHKLSCEWPDGSFVQLVQKYSYSVAVLSHRPRAACRAAAQCTHIIDSSVPRLVTPLCIRPPARWRSKKDIAIICVCSRSRRRLRRLGRLLTQINTYTQI